MSNVWTVVGEGDLRVSGVTLTPTGLELEVRARTATERAILETLDDDAGAVDTRALADGTTQALDRAGGDNTYTLTPPSVLGPERIERDWVVEDVARERLSADTQAVAASVSFLAADTRTAVTGYTDTADSTQWTFDFQIGTGTIVTDRVSELEQSAVTTLQLVLDENQTELFETVLAATAGAVVSVVPDGQTFSRDTTPNDRQTVTVTPPSGAADPAITTGDYVVSGWESVGMNGRNYRITVELSSRFEDV